MTHLYDNESIYLGTPIDQVKYRLKLYFADIKLFKEIRDLLFLKSKYATERFTIL